MLYQKPVAVIGLIDYTRAMTNGQRAWRIAEMVLLFMGAPLLIYFEILPGPKIPWLALFSLGCALWLLQDKEYDNRRFYRSMNSRHYLRVILLRGVAVAVAILGFVLVLIPDNLLGFPLHRPWFWLMVMVLYPVLSAYPQEIAYRAFFFARYAPLFRSQTALILCNAAAFSFLHVIYDNPWAVILTLPAGWLMARTYAVTGSLLLVSLEHGIYGCLSFTLGLGRFFYEGH